MRNLDSELESAKAEHANTVRNQTNVAAKLASAVDAHAVATNGRAALIETAAAGGEPDLAALDLAQAALARAQATVQLWTDAQLGAAAAVGAAEKPVIALQEEIGKQRFILATKARLAAAARLDRAGRELVEAYYAWEGTVSELHAARVAGRIRLNGDIIDRSEGFKVIPQTIGFSTWGQSSFPSGLTLEGRERGTFGQWAILADALDDAAPAQSG